MATHRKKGRIARILLITTTLLVIAFFAGRYFLFREIRNALKDRIIILQKQGIVLEFDSLYLNPWNGSISVFNLNVSISKDSTRTNIKASIPGITIHGVRVMPFLIDHSLAIRNIVLTDPKVIYRRTATLPDSKSQRAFLEGINIDDIRINHASFILLDSLNKDSLCTFAFDLTVRQLGMQQTGDSLVWYDADIALRKATISVPKAMYRFSIASVRLNLTEGEFAMDSLKIIPLYPKKKFMKLSGKQTDRISGTVPSVRIHGLRFRRMPGLIVQATNTELAFHLDVFRDKRYPFIKKRYTCLPMNFLQRLPFALQADTLRLTDSYVRYQEFPEDADSAGYVYFEHLKARITNIHNDPKLSQAVAMDASAQFMGRGNLNVHFTFPADTTQPCKATGSLREFAMSRLNTMLGPAAKARIESGTMTNLKFHFAYNMHRSVGQVELNYKNLKVSSLREKDDKAAISFVKTLLLNAFIRKDMDEDVDANDKTGTILFYRNTKRSIFNYWWKSLFSGIKSAYNLDKLPVASKNDSAKEERKDAERKREKQNKKKDKDKDSGQ